MNFLGSTGSVPGSTVTREQQGFEDNSLGIRLYCDAALVQLLTTFFELIHTYINTSTLKFDTHFIINTHNQEVLHFLTLIQKRIK